MSYTTKDIRNVCLLGHGGSGKTTLTENMLYLTGAIDRQGKVNDGNTVCDYDAEEIKRQVTISAAIAPISFGGKKINVIDCPGFQDFAGEVAAALRAVEAGIIFCTIFSPASYEACFPVSCRWSLQPEQSEGVRHSLRLPLSWSRSQVP